MTITSILVLFAVIWFMTLLIALPIGLRTQGDVDDVVEGTPQSAPANVNMRRKMLIVTLITLPLWIGLCLIIQFEVISVADFDFRGVLSR
jgi:predicted secreted protein